LKEIVNWLNSHANPKNVEGMARFGINPKDTLGISLYDLRPFAKKIPKNHRLALELWKTGIHEARLLAPMIDISKEAAEELKKSSNKTSRWIARDALRELKSDAVQKRIRLLR